MSWAARISSHSARGLLAEALLDDRQQSLAVLEPQQPGGEARVVGEVPHVERVAELRPERLVAAGDEEPLTVAALVEAIGRVLAERASACRDSRWRSRTAAPARRAAARSRCADRAGAVANEERGQHGLRGKGGGVVVGGRGAQILRRPAEALQRHEPAHGLQQGIEAGAIDIGTGGAEGGHRAVDELGLRASRVRVAHASRSATPGRQFSIRTSPSRASRSTICAALGRLEVERDGALAAVPAEEARQLAERVALQRLHLDDGGAEVGEHHRRVGAGDVAGQVDDTDSVERRR